MKTWIKIMGGIIVVAGVGWAGLYFGKQLGKDEVEKTAVEHPVVNVVSGKTEAEEYEVTAEESPTLRQAVSEAAVVVLGNEVEEIAESETAQRVLKEVARGELAVSNITHEVVVDIAVDVLGEQVEEIGESETSKKVLKDLAGGGSSDTNAPSPTTTDIMVDVLGEQVDEVGENELLKDVLKGLGNSLFD